MKKLKLSKLFKGFGLLEYLLVLSPIADALVGIGKHNDIALIAVAGPAHKIILLVLLVVMVFRSDKVKRWQAWIIISSILLCFLHLLYVFLAYGVGDIGDNLNTTIRFWFFPIVVVGFICIYGQKLESEKWHRVLTILALLYSALLLIPTFLGVNNASYEDWLEKVGSAGLFYEANEIGIICGLLASYMVMYYFLRKSSVSVLIIALITVSAALATGTKAALVYLVVAMLYIVFATFSRLKKLRVNIIGVIVVLVAVTIAAQGVLSNISGSYDRQIVNNSGGLNDLIFNGRDVLLVQNLNQFNSDYSLNDRIFGGSSVQHDGMEKKDTEMDFADVLFNFGYIGFIVYVSAIILILGKVIFRRTGSEANIEKVAFVAGILAAAIMGHTLSSPSVGLILAIFAIIVNEHREMKRKDE